jgi:hypothetical protein
LIQQQFLILQSLGHHVDYNKKGKGLFPFPLFLAKLAVAATRVGRDALKQVFDVSEADSRVKTIGLSPLDASFDVVYAYVAHQYPSSKYRSLTLRFGSPLQYRSTLAIRPRDS